MDFEALTAHVTTYATLAQALSGHPYLPAQARLGLVVIGQVMSALVDSHQELAKHTAALQANVDDLTAHVAAARAVAT